MHRNFRVFELERFMSTWESQVEYNLSGSGVAPLSLRDLAKEDPRFLDSLLDLKLTYPQANGSDELREQIAGYYPGAGGQNIVVTNGASQANFTSILAMLDVGDEIVIMIPNYLQIWGLAQNMGLKVKTFSLKEELGWKVDVEELNKAVTSQTRLIAVCNPNNPTGHIMDVEERQAVISAARRCGAWILADEVFAGEELWAKEITPSFWGEYEKVLAIRSLSKAYGLPGLRLGWVVAPAETAAEIWARQDYVCISASILSDKIATFVLRPDISSRLRERTCALIRDGYRVFDDWMKQYPQIFSFVPPQAAPIVYARYQRNIHSVDLVKRLIAEQKTYVVPGGHLGMEQHLRIGYGRPAEYLVSGLERIVALLQMVD